MSVPLIEVIRGDVVESIHQGDIAVVNHEGRLLYSAGDHRKQTYFRSAAKPIQAMNVLLSGAAAAFQLTDSELAVISSSHYAEPYHIEAVKAILKKIGLTADNVLGGIVPSLNIEYALQVARKGVELTPLFSDCSGKHAGFLAVCRHKTYSYQDYLQPDHPIQQEILDILANFSDMDREKIAIGVDGCSAPVHAMPIYNMAVAYARLVAGTGLSAEYMAATERIFSAMNAYPEMISGSGGFCTELIRHTNGKLIGKVGAEGVYCVGLKKEKIGVAVKIENGSMAVLPPVVVSILKQLDVLESTELDKLAAFAIVNNLNDMKTVVGRIEPVFELLSH